MKSKAFLLLGLLFALVLVSSSINAAEKTTSEHETKAAAAQKETKPNTVEDSKPVDIGGCGCCIRHNMHGCGLHCCDGRGAGAPGAGSVGGPSYGGGTPGFGGGIPGIGGGMPGRGRIGGGIPGRGGGIGGIGGGGN